VAHAELGEKSLVPQSDLRHDSYGPAGGTRRAPPIRTERGERQEEDVAVECAEGLIATGIRRAYPVFGARQELVVARVAAWDLQLPYLMLVPFWMSRRLLQMLNSPSSHLGKASSSVRAFFVSSIPQRKQAVSEKTYVSSGQMPSRLSGSASIVDDILAARCNKRFRSDPPEMSAFPILRLLRRPGGGDKRRRMCARESAIRICRAGAERHFSRTGLGSTQHRPSA